MINFIDKLLYTRGVTPVAYTIGGRVDPTDEVKALQERNIAPTGLAGAKLHSFLTLTLRGRE